MVTETVAELRKIRTDLDMLTNLYSKLVDRLISEMTGSASKSQFLS
ncbi:MAG TPA: hypothetical protein VF354_01340 [Candidatus Methanoperedens sp.]